MNNYLQQFIQEFISFIVPKGKTHLVVENSDQLSNRQQYDYLILLHVLEKEKDILSLLKKAANQLKPNGRLIIIYKNYLYSFLIKFFQAFNAYNRLDDNWLSTTDVKTFLELVDFEPFLQQPLCFTPVRVPLVTFFLNRFLLYFFPFNHLSSSLYVMARKKPLPAKKPRVSIIIPARNEEGNIKNLFQQIPHLSLDTEVIFVEGHSKDNTCQEIEKCLKLFIGKRKIKFGLVKQGKGTGKADAVRLGFAKAKGDILIIYDADMTVTPNDLIEFYSALISGKGDFINGSRLVYPLEKGAMQMLNILGNKFFALFYSWILGQNIKDTLCGTKAFFRKDYQLIQKNSLIPLGKDPFGDFYLLLGASRINLKIIDLPVRYYDRTYGATNIRRFQNAWQLFKFALHAIKKIKMRSL